MARYPAVHQMLPQAQRRGWLPGYCGKPLTNLSTEPRVVHTPRSASRVATLRLPHPSE